jgi:hypothetical protein
VGLAAVAGAYTIIHTGSPDEWRTTAIQCWWRPDAEATLVYDLGKGKFTKVVKRASKARPLKISSSLARPGQIVYYDVTLTYPAKADQFWCRLQAGNAEHQVAGGGPDKSAGTNHWADHLTVT